MRQAHIRRLLNRPAVRFLTATADNLADAILGAYRRVEEVKFENAYYRRDIGQKALAALEV